MKGLVYYAYSMYFGLKLSSSPAKQGGLFTLGTEEGFYKSSFESQICLLPLLQEKQRQNTL
jgi:hypothetical protein